jgi:hypothetical protein
LARNQGVTFDELNAEISDIALERMRLGLEACGLTPDELPEALSLALADAAGRQVAAEYVAAVTPTGPAHQ